MNKQNAISPLLRSRVRRTIVEMGGLATLGLLALGITCLFSVWTLNREHQAAVQQTNDEMSVVNLGRSAQVHFKIQVQEWKNVLLRGGVSVDYAHHSKAFAREAAVVQSALSRVTIDADRLGLRDVAIQARAIGRNHAELGMKYTRALSAAPKEHWNPYVLDRKLKGIDRSLDEQFNTMVVSLLDAAEARHKDSIRTVLARYETLRNFIGQAILLAFVLVIVILWRALSKTSEWA